MARFNIELSVTGAANTNKALSSVNREATSLEKGYQRLQSTIRDLSSQQGNLQTSMQRLNVAFKSGRISEAQFTKQSDKLSLELSDVGGKIQQAQSRLTSFSATMKQATNASRSFGTANKQLQGYANDFTSGIRSSNAVAIEFSRIIQDAPYGMQGVANNLQQLTQNYAYYTRSVREAAAAQGQTVTTGALVRGALGSLLSPINLLTLGISAVTAGWVAYERWSQRAAKATKEAEDEMTALINSLDELSASMYEGAKSAGSEIGELEVLYATIRDGNSSYEDRLKAVKSIQNQYPAYFGQLSQEEILVGEAAVAYRQLRSDILSAAQAQSVYGRIGEKSSEQLAIDEANIDIQKEINRLKQENLLIEQETPKELLKSVELTADQARNVQKLQKLGDLFLKSSDKNIRNQTQYAINQALINELEDESSNNLLNRAEIQEDINNLIDLGVSLQKNQVKEIEKGNETVQKQVNIWDRIIKLQQQFQLDGLNGYEKDIQAIKNKYDEELRLAKRNNDAVRELERLRLAEIGRVLGNTQFTQGLMAPSSPVLNTGAGQVVQRNIQQPYVAPKVDWSDFEDGLKRATNRFVRDFTTGLDRIAQDANYKIGGILAGLGTNIANSMLPVFQNFFANKLEGLLAKSFDSLSKKFNESASKAIQGIAAGAAVVGNIISQVSKPTSAAGQGIGGALSGAATGLTVGASIGSGFPVIGTIVGGLIGAISGIFGANRRRKLEEEMLAEQRKQTAIMERQQRLSYTSQIIGQQTNQGIFTGVERNAFGDIEFTIQGRALKGVLQREDAAQARGL